ncbi:putative actin-29 [Hyposmocoma kahamanoa]|uniref:putative actin-29 n=1 Tax=Hyposmocoma kahamanoa TaxID=1477025 RepID=UPI000E6D67B5|nr:putative actin-29 [Hyposmocoma kahamanoa]
MASFEKPAVIIDNGSYCIKAGFSCDNHPVAIFRTVVGRPNTIAGRYGRPGQYYEILIGDDAGLNAVRFTLKHLMCRRYASKPKEFLPCTAPASPPACPSILATTALISVPCTREALSITRKCGQVTLLDKY